MSDGRQQKVKSASDIRRQAALTRDVVPAVVALVLIELAVTLADPDAEAGGWSLLLWMLPLLPAAWLVRSQLRALRRADELQQRQQLAAMAVGFATMVMLSLAGSLLVAGSPDGNQAQWLQITFIGGIAAWGLALAVVTGRDR